MADTSFFGRLTKLFRSQAVVTIDKDGKRNVFDGDERQQTNLSSLKRNSLVNIEIIYKYSYLLFIIAILLLISVEIIGVLGKGATRWIRVF